jgi:hypothetical protein
MLNKDFSISKSMTSDVIEGHMRNGNYYTPKSNISKWNGEEFI